MSKVLALSFNKSGHIKLVSAPKHIFPGIFIPQHRLLIDHVKEGFLRNHKCPYVVHVQALRILLHPPNDSHLKCVIYFLSAFE